MREKQKKHRLFQYTAGAVVLVFFVILSPLIGAITPTDYIWKDIGISTNSGRWQDVAGSSDAQKLIAASDGKVYRSTNGGKNWMQITSLPVSSVASVASSGDGNRLFVVKGGTSDIWVSSDGAVSWTTRTMPVAFPYGGGVIKTSLSGDTLYVSVGSKLYQSTDDGLSWTSKADLSATCVTRIQFAISAVGDKVLVSCQYNSTAVYSRYSIDSGGTWSNVTVLGSDTQWGQPFLSGDGSTMFLTKGRVSVYRSSDAGASWQQSTAIESVAAVSFDGSVVIGGLEQPNGDDHPATIWLSKDSGLTWTKIDKLNAFGDWFIPSGVISSDKQTMVVGPTNGALSYTDDGGTTWHVDTAPATDQHEWSEVATSIDGKTVYAVNWWYAGPIQKSTDGGGTWNPIEAAGFEYWDNIATSGDGETIVASQGFTWYSGYLHISHDGGETWTTVLKDDYRNWTRISVSDDGQDIIAANGYDNGGLYISHDGGVTWNNTAPTATPRFMSVAMSRDGEKAVAASSYNSVPEYLYTSKDGGDTWQQLTLAGSRDWQEVACSQDCSRMVATTDGGYVYVSHDAGQTWQEHQEMGAKRWGSLAMSYDGLRVALSEYWESSPVYLSDDSGQTWVQQTNTTSASDNWMNFAFSADGTVLYGVAGTYGNPDGSGRVYRADRVAIVPASLESEQLNFASATRALSGKGTPGSTAELTLPNGRVLSMVVGYTGMFSFSIPADIPAGSTVTLAERSAAGTSSTPVSFMLGVATTTTTDTTPTPAVSDATKLAITGSVQWVAMITSVCAVVIALYFIIVFSKKHTHFHR